MRLSLFLTIFLIMVASRAQAQFGCDVQDYCDDLPVCGGLPPGSPTFFCEGETLTFINCTEPDLVDITIICWGDGYCDTIPGPPVSMTHSYDFSYDTCLVSASQALTLPITMTVINECPAGVSENCIITFVKIKVDPVAEFSQPNHICAGEQAFFNNLTCENADTASYKWYVDGVFQGFSEDLIYTFSPEGAYQVMLIAENECGPDTIIQTVNVLDVPEAEASFTLSPASGCAPVTVYFENLSQGQAISCHWTFPPGVTFIDSTSATSCEPVVIFPSDQGNYQVTLTVTNPCGMDTYTLNIPVYNAPSANLAPIPPSCEELLYTPSITYGGAIDTWQWIFENGSPETSQLEFPTDILFETSGSVTLIISGPCGADTITRPVTILTQDIVLTPADTVCSTADPFFLQASPAQGSWSGPGVTPAGLFTPAQSMAGSNVFVYTISFQGCTKADSMEIFVLNTPPVDPGSDESLCLSTGDHLLSFSPADGVWSGNGIADSLLGIFNTQLAGTGAHGLSYTFTDPLNGCVTTGQKTITVVGTPEIGVADTTFTCATAQDIDLNELLSPVFNPPPGPGQVVWTGNGVVTTGGIFNSGGVADAFDLAITYTVPPGCDTSVSFTLVLSALVQPDAGAGEEVCQNENTLVLMGSPLYPYPIGVWSGPQIDPQTGEIDLNALSPLQTYEYTYTIFPGTPCESSDQVEVELFPAGGVSAPGQLYACVTDEMITLPTPTPPPPAGAWTGEALTGGNQVNIQGLSAPVGPHVYTYTVPTLPGACNSVEVELVVEAQPVAAFSNPAIGCAGGPVDFQNTTTGADQYFWNFGDGQTSTDTQPSHQYFQAGDYDITLEAYTLNPLTNQTLCTHFAVGTIHIIDPPAVAFTTDLTQGCGPLDVTVDNQSQGEGVTYTWNWGAGLVSVEEPGTLTFPPGVEDTTYTIVLSAGNQCDTLSDSVTVTVLPLPNAAFGVTNNQPCSGMYVEANNTSTGNPAENSWYLDGVLEVNTLNLPPFQLFTGSTPTDYHLMLVTQNQCGFDTAQAVITTIPTDVVALFNMSDTVVCVGDTLLLTAFATPGAVVHWDIPGVGTYVADQVQHIFGEEGLYEIILYAGGCGYDSMSRFVTVLPLPELSLVYDPIACKNAPVSFEVMSDAPGHLVSYGDSITSNATMSQHAYTTADTFLLQLTATSVAGCTNTWEGAIVIVENPIAAFVPPQSVCANIPVTFTSQTPEADQCVWDFGDGPPIQGCTITHTYGLSGVYPVTLVVISEEGCRDTISQLYQVKATPEAFFTYTILEECTPGQVVFEDVSTGSFGIQWSFGGDQPMEEKEYPLGGTYPVTLQAVNGDCVDTYMESVTILQGPSLDFEIDPNCTVGEGSNLTVSTSEASDWVGVTGTGYGASGNYHPNLGAGVYTIIAQALNGCEEEEEALVLPPNEIHAQLLEDSFDILLGQIVNLQLQYNQSNLAFQWTPAGWLSDPSAPDPVARPFETVSYVVAVSDSLGCVKYDTAFIRVREDRDTSIYLPNTFTPDNNGFNDVFMVRSNNPGMFQVRSFLVYDMDGALVFESRDCQANLPSCGWDGRFRGKPAYQGVYRWQYELEFIDGHTVRDNGTVMLMR